MGPIRPNNHISIQTSTDSQKGREIENTSFFTHVEVSESLNELSHGVFQQSDSFSSFSAQDLEGDFLLDHDFTKVSENSALLGDLLTDEPLLTPESEISLKKWGTGGASSKDYICFLREKTDTIEAYSIDSLSRKEGRFKNKFMEFSLEEVDIIQLAFDENEEIPFEIRSRSGQAPKGCKTIQFFSLNDEDEEVVYTINLEKDEVRFSVLSQSEYQRIQNVAFLALASFIQHAREVEDKNREKSTKPQYSIKIIQSNGRQHKIDQRQQQQVDTAHLTMQKLGKTNVQAVDATLDKISLEQERIRKEHAEKKLQKFQERKLRDGAKEIRKEEIKLGDIKNENKGR